MISPLGSKWSLGTNENKDRAQYLQVLKPKTSKHSDCTYSRIWQCQINLHGSYTSQQCNWQTYKLTAEFFIIHSVFSEIICFQFKHPYQWSDFILIAFPARDRKCVGNKGVAAYDNWVQQNQFQNKLKFWSILRCDKPFTGDLIGNWRAYKCTHDWFHSPVKRANRTSKGQSNLFWTKEN